MSSRDRHIEHGSNEDEGIHADALRRRGLRLKGVQYDHFCVEVAPKRGEKT